MAYISFQLTHDTRGPCCSGRVSNGSPKEDKKLLQFSQLCHQGEFRHLSVSARRPSWQCCQSLHGLFLRAVLPAKVEVSTQAVATDGKTKAFISLPPRWDSSPKILYFGQHMGVIMMVLQNCCRTLLINNVLQRFWQYQNQCSCQKSQGYCLIWNQWKYGTVHQCACSCH